MHRKMIVALAGLIFLTAIPAFADNAGCKNGKFVGTYTLANPNVNVFGDGSVVHSYVFQLTFNSDGTVNRNWTGFLDYFVNAGTGSELIGSWTCRSDGSLVATMIAASYFPVPAHSVPAAPSADVSLLITSRISYLYTIVDDDTVRQIQRRERRYTANQDPSDPNGGTLLAATGGTFDWKRLTASDADLLAP